MNSSTVNDMEHSGIIEVRIIELTPTDLKFLLNPVENQKNRMEVLEIFEF